MAGPSAAPDDLEAVRAIVDALKPFAVDDQRRILRWAQEKLGIVSPSPITAPMVSVTSGAESAPVPAVGTRDIRSFIQEKRPGSDVQLATAVAYYYAFEAPPATRKGEITAADLQESARLSARARLHNPTQTLHNAAKLGYLDKGSTRGTFRVNTVGENLVAMAMPESGTTEASVRKRPGRRPAQAQARARRKKAARGRTA